MRPTDPPDMESKTVIGLDPDTKATGWAFLQGGKVKAVGVIMLEDKACKGQRRAAKMAGAVTRAMAELPHMHVAVVEGQQIYRNGKIDSNGLLKIAAVSGAAVGALMHRAERVEFPLPREWKGQTPKGVHQCRVLEEIGWEFKFMGRKAPPKILKVPDDVEVVGPPIPNGHWKEVVDAIGLALWGHKKK